jgi:hypothetical protein
MLAHEGFLRKDPLIRGPRVVLNAYEVPVSLPLGIVVLLLMRKERILIRDLLGNLRGIEGQRPRCNRKGRGHVSENNWIWSERMV